MEKVKNADIKERIWNSLTLKEQKKQERKALKSLLELDKKYQIKQSNKIS